MAMVLRACMMLFLVNFAVRAGGVEEFSRQDFGPGFVFGAGTSAYQVEGAANEDGRTPSIWDTFTHAGKMEGETGDIACDGYHKYKEDVQLMVDLGLEAYRFSISWSRLITNGRGAVNPKGLDFYNNFIDELISHGVEPHVTLHHCDLPQALDDEYGGWVSRKIVKDFTAYADVCFREFGGRVLHWTTINEANVFTVSGYDIGNLPPQRCSAPFGDHCSRGNSSTEPYLAGHHILLAHASAARLYKIKYKDTQHGLIGLNVFSFGLIPATNTTEDVVATQRANDFYVGWFFHPLSFGVYPETMKENVGSRLPSFTKSESKLVKGSFDFLGVNYYNTLQVKDDSSILNMEVRDFYADTALKFVGFQNSTTEFEFPSTPWGLQVVLEYIKQVYGNPPIYIQENGQRTRSNSSLEDWGRVNFLQGHIGSLLYAIRNGSNVKGYYTWSFMDVFEMLDSLESSYGLYYVDLRSSSLERHPKLSAHWYSQFLKGGKIYLEGAIQLANTSFSIPGSFYN